MFKFLRRKLPNRQPPTAQPSSPQPGGVTPTGAAILRIDGATMGTRYRVSCVVPTDQDRDMLTAEVHRAVDLVDCQMSTWKPASALSRFNRCAPDDWFSVPPDLAHVIEAGLGVSRGTQGAFDMTVGDAVNLWGYGPAGPRQDPPDAAAAEAAGKSTGFAVLEVRRDPPALRKTAPCYVDLSGIAKGYGVDRIAAALEENGVHSYFAAIDGEVRLRGRKPGPDPRWTVSLDAPIAGETQAWDILTPPDGALATSGDYRHFFRDGDTTYAHTIDPRTGRPVANDVASVTVFHRDCMMADAWATALLVLGVNRGAALAEARNIPALFLNRTPDGIDEVMTGGFEDLFASDPLAEPGMPFAPPW